MRLPVLGHLLPLRRDPLAFYTKLQKAEGDIASFKLGPMDAVLVSDPELAVEVLQRDVDRYRKGFGNDVLAPLIDGSLFLLEGEQWKPRRRLIQPMLRLENLRALLPAIHAEIADELSGWAQETEPVALYERLRPCVLRAMGTALLGTDAMADPVLHKALNTLWLSTNRRLWHIAPWMDRLPLKENRDFNRTLALIRPVVQQIRNAGRGPLVPGLRDGGLTDSDVDAEVLTFLIAGQECTAIAAAWTLHMASVHAHVQEALGHEARGVEDPPEFDTLWNLEQTRHAIDESLRLFPPAWMVARQANEEHDVGGCPVKKDAVVMVCPYIVHRHPEQWIDPDAFDPDRAGAKTPRAFMPFGTGPRSCVGANLARIIATTIVVETMRRYELTAVTRPKPAPMLTLRPDDPMWTRVRPRSANLK